MTSRDYLKVGLKLLGVYFVTTGLSYIPAVYALSMSVATGELDEQGKAIVANVASTSIRIIIGTVLALKAGLIAALISGQETETADKYEFDPSTVLRLLGVYLVVISVDVLHQIFEWTFFGEGSFSTKIGMLGPSWITFCVGLAFVLWAKRIWGMLGRFEKGV